MVNSRFSSADVPNGKVKMTNETWCIAFNQTEFLSGHEV